MDVDDGSFLLKSILFRLCMEGVVPKFLGGTKPHRRHSSGCLGGRNGSPQDLTKLSVIPVEFLLNCVQCQFRIPL